MTKILRVLCASAALLLATLPGQAASPSVTILCYHEVEPAEATLHETVPRKSATGPVTEEKKRYVTYLHDFRAQLDYLKRQSYTVIPLADLHAFITGRLAALPERAVVVTVDDGWLCAKTEIAPEMQKRSLPWTLFVYPKTINRGNHSLTWKQVNELSGSGVDIQSHSFTHPFLSRRQHQDLTPEAYDVWLENELLGSRTAIEKETGKPVHFLCYPFGDYDAEVMAVARKYGYLAAVTTERGTNGKGSDVMRLKRQLLHNDTTLAEFSSWLPALPTTPPETIIVPFGSPEPKEVVSPKGPVTDPKTTPAVPSP